MSCVTRRIAVVLALVLAATAFAELGDDFVPLRDDPAIEYATRPTHDPISVLNEELEGGRARLKFDGQQGYLRSVLEALRIPVESQIAVFSKTSVQAKLINPQNPRTLFFNDSVVVGWVRGGFIEVAAESTQQGIIFYYPCSYMIYSEAFDALPVKAQQAVYDRMWQILSGKDKSPRYARVSLADTRAVVEILRETKRGVPDYFQQPVR